jgi:hypothetical protein
MSYITTADIYNEGVDPADYPAPDVQLQIDMWQEFIEHACGQWFEDRLVEFYIDGTGCNTLWFQVPVISIDELYVNDDFVTEYDLTKLVVYNGDTATRDDRKNPRIAIKTEDEDDFYSRPRYPYTIFARGKQNQKVKGHFGYLDNGATPERIKWILKKLVINHLGKLGDPGSGVGVDPLAALTKKEVTDGHSIEYAAIFGSGGVAKKLDYLDVVQDPVINGILKMFKAPRIVKMVYSTPTDPEA